MIQGLYSAVAGMINQETVLEVAANNLANVSTFGYKRDNLSFSGMLNPLPQAETSILNLVAQPMQPMAIDTVTAKFATDFSQGGLQRTDNSYDLALEGEGFFVIQHADGIRYTRSGNFARNAAGQLVTIEGYPVLGINGVIQIRGDQMQINDSGQVIVDGQPVATLRLVDFQDKTELIKAGDNAFAKTNAAVTEMPASCEVRQGFMELSNVTAIHEMVRMIECMRVYESYQKTIQSIHETLRKANEELGKISI